MSLIEQFPQLGPAGGGSGGASTSANNTWTGQNTFSAEVDIDGALTVAATGIALNGSTQTISTSTPLARITGSTASSTIALPASPIANQVVQLDNQASASWTLSGNGANIDGAASKTVAATGPIAVWYSGTAWESLTWSQFLLDARYPTLNGSNSLGGTNQFLGALQIEGQFQIKNQAASSSSYTVTGGSNGAVVVNSTYSSSGAQTISLIASPSSTQVVWIVDEGLSAGTNNITVSGNGKNVNGSSSIVLAKNGASVLLRYNGTGWFVMSAYNYP